MSPELVVNFLLVQGLSISPYDEHVLLAFLQVVHNIIHDFHLVHTSGQTHVPSQLQVEYDLV